ncbi:hypothetical protein UFOVP181_19 [uncultured Caudovirales phage]|uniref:Uncharacterized protein n=1 Tax=uncultured Caudovirales phage TaxID=2100421 RepID=A0A6J5KVW6_9CAUD|nr:hypothetical protein UFOVP57_144 [uncultured Caudovirales phage]CAB5208426.1 hypothetical protein UFOVP181_19 [uncultured Caudovirales phage]
METKLLPWQKRMLAMMAGKDRAVLNVARQSGKSASVGHIGKLLQEWSDTYSPKRLILGTGTAFGVKYYLAEPVGMDWVAVLKWSTETFGEMSHIKDGDRGRWYINNRTLYFRNLKDRDWFVLRWNS